MEVLPYSVYKVIIFKPFPSAKWILLPHGLSRYFILKIYLVKTDLVICVELKDFNTSTVFHNLEFELAKLQFRTKTNTFYTHTV